MWEAPDMSDLSASVGEVAGVIRTMFGMTRPNRVRDHIKELTELYAALDSHPRLSSSAEKVAGVIEQMTGRLVDAHRGSARQWNWPSCIASWIIAGLLIWALVVLYPAPFWWSIVLFIVAAIGAVLFTTAGIKLLLDRKEETA
jgi:Flp pilus assembly protein TadB